MLAESEAVLEMNRAHFAASAALLHHVTVGNHHEKWSPEGVETVLVFVVGVKETHVGERTSIGSPGQVPFRPYPCWGQSGALHPIQM